MGGWMDGYVFLLSQCRLIFHWTVDGLRIYSLLKMLCLTRCPIHETNEILYPFDMKRKQCLTRTRRPSDKGTRGPWRQHSVRWRCAWWTPKRATGVKWSRNSENSMQQVRCSVKTITGHKAKSSTEGWTVKRENELNSFLNQFHCFPLQLCSPNPPLNTADFFIPPPQTLLNQHQGSTTRESVQPVDNILSLSTQSRDVIGASSFVCISSTQYSSSE